MRIYIFIALLFLACESASEAELPPPLAAQVAAFNAHNVDAMVANMDTSFIWFDVYSDSTAVQVKGIAAFRAAMEGYFKHFPRVKTELLETTQSGEYVSFRERAQYFGSGSKLKTQEALGVYQMKNNKIYRAWYYY